MCKHIKILPIFHYRCYFIFYKDAIILHIFIKVTNCNFRQIFLLSIGIAMSSLIYDAD